MQKIIDTHLHTWDLQNLDYYWLKNDTSILAKTYLLNQVEPLLSQAQVTAAILVQATNSLAETDWFLSLAQEKEYILAAVVWLPLNEEKSFDLALQNYLQNPYFKGVRHQIHDEADTQWLLQPNVMQSLKLLAKNNIPYDLVGTKPQHIQTAIEVAKKIPDLNMVFDHLNQPPYSKKTEWLQWCNLMAEAAKLPNLYAKISGLGTTVTKPQWNAKDIEPAVEFVLNNFGVDKIFCGGDWPVSLLAGSYVHTWQQYQHLFNQLLSTDDRHKILCSNAENFYNIKHPN